MERGGLKIIITRTSSTLSQRYYNSPFSVIHCCTTRRSLKRVDKIYEQRNLPDKSTWSKTTENTHDKLLRKLRLNMGLYMQ